MKQTQASTLHITNKEPTDMLSNTKGKYVIQSKEFTKSKTHYNILHH